VKEDAAMGGNGAGIGIHFFSWWLVVIAALGWLAAMVLFKVTVLGTKAQEERAKQKLKRMQMLRFEDARRTLEEAIGVAKGHSDAAVAAARQVQEAASVEAARAAMERARKEIDYAATAADAAALSRRALMSGGKKPDTEGTGKAERPKTPADQIVRVAQKKIEAAAAALAQREARGA
jgi:hypothetical protein